MAYHDPGVLVWVASVLQAPVVDCLEKLSLATTVVARYLYILNSSNSIITGL